MPAYTITPQDVLFFRDGRPIHAGGGHGANWPLPSLFFDAVHAALYRANGGEPADWEHVHKARKSEPGARRFGSLATAGPFPVRRNDWLFPAPADLAPDRNVLALAPLPAPSRGVNSLPTPLTRPVGALTPPAKTATCPWIDRSGLEAWATGTDGEGQRFSDRDLFDGEWFTGIGMNSETGTQDKERLYAAEYLRLHEGIQLGTWASMPVTRGDDHDGMTRLFQDGSIMIMGGQQRPCGIRIAHEDISALMPVSPPLSGTRVKWTLLSPALYPAIGDHPGGWLPTWVDSSSGKVLLRNGPGAGKARRRQLTEGGTLDVKLIAAVIPGAVAFSGWDIAGNRAKQTRLAVPGGSVYYFEGPDAPALADLLNWHGPDREQAANIVHRRSSLMGEKGFGLGLCGPWMPAHTTIESHQT